MIDSILRSMGYVPETVHARMREELEQRNAGLMSELIGLKTHFDAQAAAHTEKTNTLARLQTTHNNVMGQMAELAEKLRICELRNSGMADERVTLENELAEVKAGRDEFESALKSANDRLTKFGADLDKIATVVNAYVDVTSTAGGKVSRYSSMLTVSRAGLKHEITVRSLAASAKNKRELESDVENIRKICGLE
jgi:chromosome segregation ATPase